MHSEVELVLELDLELEADFPFSLTLCLPPSLSLAHSLSFSPLPSLSVFPPTPQPLLPSPCVGIKERWRHQRPVTTGVNGASHVCIHTHRHERQVLQLEMGAFGD